MADMDNHSKNNDCKLDELLDNMLATYSSAEPRPGLETRILAQVKAQGKKQDRRSNFRWLWTAVAVASAAAVLILIYESRPVSGPAPSQIAVSPKEQEKVPATQPKKKPTLSAATGTKPSVRQNRILAARVKQPSHTEVAVVKQEVFPSPSPLSEQEKLLFRYLAHTPREELIAQSRPDPPNDDTDEDAQEPRPQNLTQVPMRNSNTR